MQNIEDPSGSSMPVKFHVVFEGVRRYKEWSRNPKRRAQEIYHKVKEFASARDCDFNGDCPDAHHGTGWHDKKGSKDMRLPITASSLELVPDNVADDYRASGSEAGAQL